jgi:hypothetical protein
MTRSEVAKLVAVLCCAYPNAKISADTSTVYENMLADLEVGLANAAVKRLLATAKWIPTIAEIRSAVLEAQHGASRPGGDAWGDVLQAVHRFGMYREPVFTDSTVTRCVKQLGWTEICQSENQQADRARFIELYDRLAVSGRRELQMPPDVRRLPEPERGGSLQESLHRVLKLMPGGDS